MEYTTYFLKFDSQEESEVKFEEAGYKVTTTLPNEEEVTYYSVTDQVGNIDIIGDIYNNDAVIEYEEGAEFPTVVSPATKKDGWHVNIILEGSLPECLQPYIVNPQNPYRVFA